MHDIRILRGSSEEELRARNDLFNLFKNSPIPEEEFLSNLGLYSNRQLLSRILSIHEIYLKIIHVHRVIMEFGVRWGQNLALFSSFRGIYEPFNYNRKVIGFDTFSGFPKIHQKDGNKVSEGDYSVTSGYEDYLTNILAYHEKESPISHKRKFELVKGDATITIYEYLKKILKLLLPLLTLTLIFIYLLKLA